MEGPEDNVWHRTVYVCDLMLAQDQYAFGADHIAAVWLIEPNDLYRTLVYIHFQTFEIDIHR